jgi:hypothetical protein
MVIQLSLIDSRKKERLQNDSNKSFKYHDIWWLVQFGRIKRTFAYFITPNVDFDEIFASYMSSMYECFTL